MKRRNSSAVSSSSSGRGGSAPTDVRSIPPMLPPARLTSSHSERSSATGGSRSATPRYRRSTISIDGAQKTRADDNDNDDDEDDDDDNDVDVSTLDRDQLLALIHEERARANAERIQLLGDARVYKEHARQLNERLRPLVSQCVRIDPNLLDEMIRAHGGNEYVRREKYDSVKAQLKEALEEKRQIERDLIEWKVKFGERVNALTTKSSEHGSGVQRRAVDTMTPSVPQQPPKITRATKSERTMIGSTIRGRIERMSSARGTGDDDVRSPPVSPRESDTTTRRPQRSATVQQFTAEAALAKQQRSATLTRMTTSRHIVSNGDDDDDDDEELGDLIDRDKMALLARQAVDRVNQTNREPRAQFISPRKGRPLPPRPPPRRSTTRNDRLAKHVRTWRIEANSDAASSYLHSTALLKVSDQQCLDAMRHGVETTRRIVVCQAAVRRFVVRRKFAREKQRWRIVDELIRTERIYVASLRLIVDVFSTPLLNPDNGQAMIVSKSDVPTIFSHIQTISLLNQAFLADLLASGMVPSYTLGYMHAQIAPVVLKYADMFKCYSNYINVLDADTRHINVLERSSRRFRTFLRRAREACVAANFNEDLHSLIIKPVQRIPRYALLFREIIDQLDERSPEHEQFTRAHAKITELAMRMNEEKRAAEMSVRMVQISRAFVEPRSTAIADLMQPHRRLVLEGAIRQYGDGATVLGVSGDNEQKHLVLFNDLLLITSRRVANNSTERLVCEHAVHVEYFSNVKLLSSGDSVTVGSDACFMIVCAADSYFMWCESRAVAEQWIAALCSVREQWLTARESMNAAASSVQLSSNVQRRTKRSSSNNGIVAMQ